MNKMRESIVYNWETSISGTCLKAMGSDRFIHKSQTRTAPKSFLQETQNYIRKICTPEMPNRTSYRTHRHKHNREPNRKRCGLAEGFTFSNVIYPVFPKRNIKKEKTKTLKIPFAKSPSRILAFTPSNCPSPMAPIAVVTPSTFKLDSSPSYSLKTLQLQRPDNSRAFFSTFHVPPSRLLPPRPSPQSSAHKPQALAGIPADVRNYLSQAVSPSQDLYLHYLSTKILK